MAECIIVDDPDCVNKFALVRGEEVLGQMYFVHAD